MALGSDVIYDRSCETIISKGVVIEMEELSESSL